MPQDLEVVRLAQAIEQFTARHPHNTSPELLKGLEEVQGHLKDSGARQDSPGQQAVRRTLPGDTGKGGTGVPFPEAATGSDRPSPGQRAAKVAGDASHGDTISDQIKTAAQEIVERMKG